MINNIFEYDSYPTLPVSRSPALSRSVSLALSLSLSRPLALSTSYSWGVRSNAET